MMLTARPRVSFATRDAVREGGTGRGMDALPCSTRPVSMSLYRPVMTVPPRPSTDRVPSRWVPGARARASAARPLPPPAPVPAPAPAEAEAEAVPGRLACRGRERDLDDDKVDDKDKEEDAEAEEPRADGHSVRVVGSRALAPALAGGRARGVASETVDREEDEEEADEADTPRGGRSPLALALASRVSHPLKRHPPTPALVAVALPAAGDAPALALAPSSPAFPLRGIGGLPPAARMALVRASAAVGAARPQCVVASAATCPIPAPSRMLTPSTLPVCLIRSYPRRLSV